MIQFKKRCIYIYIYFKEKAYTVNGFSFPNYVLYLKKYFHIKNVNTSHLNNYIQSCEFSNLLAVFVDLRTCK